MSPGRDFSSCLHQRGEQRRWRRTPHRVREVDRRDAVDGLGVQHAGHGEVGADRLEDLADLVREVRPQVAVALFAAHLAQVGLGAGCQLDIVRLGGAVQHDVELLVGDRGHEDLVLDAPEEGLVAEGGGLEVGREHHLAVERDLEAHAVAQRQVVDAPIERHDPAVEQFLGRHQLAAEVVDDEHAVVGLHLDRSEVHAIRRFVGEVEHRALQLTAGDDRRAAAQHPARVELVGLHVGGHVHHGVEHRDDLAVDLDGLRDRARGRDAPG